MQLCGIFLTTKDYIKREISIRNDDREISILFVCKSESLDVVEKGHDYDSIECCISRFFSDKYDGQHLRECCR